MTDDPLVARPRRRDSRDERLLDAARDGDHWFSEAPAIVGGWPDVVVPAAATLTVAAVVSLAGIVRFGQRDLRHG